MTALDRITLRDFAKLIAAGIKHIFFFTKKALSLSVSSQLSHIISFISFPN